MPFMEGSLVVLPIVGSKGPASMLLPAKAFKDAQRMARALGAVGRWTAQVGRYVRGVRIPFNSSPRTSLGVEWELELVDPAYPGARVGGHRGPRRPRCTAGMEGEHPKAKHELFESTVEIITGVCKTVAEAKADLAATLAEVVGRRRAPRARRDVQRHASDHRVDRRSGSARTRATPS